MFQQKVEQLELMVKEKTHNLRRLEAQRNELNTQGAGAGRVQLGCRPCVPPGPLCELPARPRT